MLRLWHKTGEAVPVKPSGSTGRLPCLLELEWRFRERAFEPGGRIGRSVGDRTVLGLEDEPGPEGLGGIVESRSARVVVDGHEIELGESAVDVLHAARVRGTDDVRQDSVPSSVDTVAYSEDTLINLRGR